MKFRTLIGIAFLVGAGLLAAALIYLSNLDVNQYREVIAKTASSIAGRKLTLAGPMKLSVGWSPSVVINDVRLANAPWGSRPDMAKIKRLEAEVRLWPLLFGDIQVKRLIVVEPDIWLETDKKGRGNWDLGLGVVGEAQGDASDRLDMVPFVSAMKLRKTRLVFIDGTSGEKHALQLDKIEAFSSGFSKPFRFEIAGQLNQVAFSGGGELGALSTLKDTSRPYPVEFKGQYAGVNLHLKGTIQEPVDLKQFDLKVTAEAKDLQGWKALAGDIVAGMGPVSISASVRGNLSQIRLESLQAKLGKTDLSGRIEAGLSGAKPLVKATLRSNRIDLDALLPQKEERTDAKGKNASPKKKPEKVFPSTPIPLDGLQLVNADVQFSGKEIQANGLAFQGVSARIRLQNGKLSIQSMKGKFAEGDFTGNVEVNGRPGTPTVAVQLKGAKFDLGRILHDAGMKDLYEGKGDLALNLKGRGRSVAAVMGTLNGESKVILGKGKLKTDALAFAVDGFRKVMGTLTSEKEKFSDVNCAVSKFAFRNGMAKSQVMLVDAEYSTVVGKGRIDLGQETLDFVVTPKPKSATLNIAIPVKFQGTLADPSFRPDELAVARKAAGLAALFVFPPAAIVGLTDLGSSEGEECLRIARGKESPQDSQASKKSTTQEVMESVEGGIKDAGRKLKSLFQ